MLTKEIDWERREIYASVVSFSHWCTYFVLFDLARTRMEVFLTRARRAHVFSLRRWVRQYKLRERSTAAAVSAQTAWMHATNRVSFRTRHSKSNKSETGIHKLITANIVCLGSRSIRQAQNQRGLYVIVHPARQSQFTDGVHRKITIAKHNSKSSPLVWRPRSGRRREYSTHGCSLYESW